MIRRRQSSERDAPARRTAAPSAPTPTLPAVVLGLQRSAGNRVVTAVMRDSTTTTPPAAPTSWPDIDALNLSATAKAAAEELRRKHPAVKFTSGRRNVHEQAHAMASNIVSSGDRKWIAKTYAAAQKLQDWVDANPTKTTVADITAGLESVMTAMPDSELAGISKHLSGDAFDVQPVTTDADAIKADMKALPGVTKFLESEGGLERWHVQF